MVLEQPCRAAARTGALAATLIERLGPNHGKLQRGQEAFALLDPEAEIIDVRSSSARSMTVMGMVLVIPSSVSVARVMVKRMSSVLHGEGNSCVVTPVPPVRNRPVAVIPDNPVHKSA